MTSLVEELLIDSKGLKTIADYEKQFDLIAEKLMNECTLQINNKPHRFVEIEFYYTDAIHADPFTHKDPLQKTNGQWYFHKIGAQYKGGTYKGLDVTCGSPKAYGGILIRGIQDLQTGEVKDGSCVSVDHILETCNVDSIQDLTKLKVYNDSATQSNGVICIQQNKATDFPKKEIVKSARVGLNMKKKEDNQTEFVMKPYRYLAFPTLTKKGKIHVALSLHMRGKTAQQIQQTTGSPLNSINNWIEWYTKGTQQPLTDFLNLALDNESLCRATGAWAKQYGSGSASSSNTTATEAPTVTTATTIEDLSMLPPANLEQNLPQFHAMFHALRMQLNSYKESDVLMALTAFRKFLSLAVNIAPIDEVYKAGLIPKFAEFLNRLDHVDFQEEAAWILTNIACSPKFEHIQAIFDADVFPQINKLLSSSNDRVYDQALWLLANLIGIVDQPKNERKVAQYRKQAIDVGIIPSLIQLGLAEQKPAVAANIGWALDNMLRSAEYLPYSQATSLLPVLAKLLLVPNGESTSYSASCVARLAEKHDEKMVQHVIDTNGLVESLINLSTEGQDVHTKNNSVQALANLTNGRPDQVEVLISRGMLSRIFQHYNKGGNIPKPYHESVARILEHVTLAADETMLQTMIDSVIFEMGEAAEPLEKLDNYIWALSNATFAAGDRQLHYLLSIDTHGKLVMELLRRKNLNKELHIAMLEGLENLLGRAPCVISSLQSEAKNLFRTQASKAEEPEIMALAARLSKLCN